MDTGSGKNGKCKKQVFRTAGAHDVIHTSVTNNGLGWTRLGLGQVLQSVPSSVLQARFH